MKRNPAVKDFLLRTTRDSFYAGIMWGLREMVNRTIKWRGKGVVPSRQILLNATKLLLTGLITVLRNKTFYDRLLLDKWKSIAGKLPVMVNEFEIVIT